MLESRPVGSEDRPAGGDGAGRRCGLQAGAQVAAGGPEEGGRSTVRSRAAADLSSHGRRIEQGRDECPARNSECGGRLKVSP